MHTGTVLQILPILCTLPSLLYLLYVTISARMFLYCVVCLAINIMEQKKIALTHCFWLEKLFVMVMAWASSNVWEWGFALRGRLKRLLRVCLPLVPIAVTPHQTESLQELFIK